MASLDISCSNLLNLKNKITKIEHKKIFCGPSKTLKNISWPINICLKYFMAPTKTLRPLSYILNGRSLRIDWNWTRTQNHLVRKVLILRMLMSWRNLAVYLLEQWPRGMQGTVTSKVRDFSIKYANYLQTSMPELKNDAIKSLTFLRLPERH